MIFTVRTRNAEGHIISEEFEATSRNDLFKTLSKRGFTAISIAEGPEKKCSKNRNIVKITCIIILTIFAIIALYVSYLKLNYEDSKQPKQIIQVKKIIKKNAVQIKQNTITNDLPKPKKYWEVDESQTNNFTRAQQRKWEIMRRPKRQPQNVVWKKARYQVFNHKSENMIAALITAKPGQGFIGTPSYNGIEEDFCKSLNDPITILDTDDEYTKQLKMDMIALKKELKKQIDAGASLITILSDARKELQELSTYRRIVESELKKIAYESSSAEDIQDAIDAANKLLDQKGIAPIKGGPITIMKLRRFNEERKK
jgi:hypothetical protein